MDVVGLFPRHVDVIQEVDGDTDRTNQLRVFVHPESLSVVLHGGHGISTVMTMEDVATSGDGYRISPFPGRVRLKNVALFVKFDDGRGSSDVEMFPVFGYP